MYRINSDKEEYFEIREVRNMSAESLKGKKVLILGGAFLNKQLVEAAKAMGIVTYVTDIDDVVHSPAKLIADKYYDIDVYDIEAIIDLCKKEKIDGAIVGGYNAPYVPYIEVCRRMGYHCLATMRQYELFSLKDNFTAMCKACGADVPQSYQESDITEDFTAYPIIVKPVDRSGSKGQSVCYSFAEVKQAIAFSKESSPRKRVIIEEYLPAKKEMVVECLIKDGQVYESMITDFYYGSAELGVDRVFKLITVSKWSISYYYEKLRPQVEKMIRYAGLENGICIVQGKKDKDKFKFYDAELRRAGCLAAEVIKKEYGISTSDILVKFSLTGKMDIDTNRRFYEFNHKIVVVWYIILKPGKICKVSDLEHIRASKNYVSFEERLRVGDAVPATGDVQQLFGVFAFVFDNEEELNDFWEKELLDIVVLDENGNNLVIDDIDRCRQILKYRESEISERV